MQAEVVANKLTDVVRARSGGDFKLPAKMDNVWNATKREDCKAGFDYFFGAAGVLVA